MAHTLNDYISLLEREGLLAAPVPADLDREQPIALVSCDSRTVVPGTLFVCKGAHFKVEFLQSAKEQGAFVYLAEKKYDQVDLPPCPASSCPTCAGPWPLWPICAMTTPPGS